MKLFFTEHDGFDLTIENLYLQQLHGGVLAAADDAELMNEKTKEASEKFQREIERMWRKRKTSFLGDLPILREDHSVTDRNWVLSCYIGAAWLGCEKPVHDNSAHGSTCVVLWMQWRDEDVLPDRVRSMIRWRTIAEDYML